MGTIKKKWKQVILKIDEEKTYAQTEKGTLHIAFARKETGSKHQPVYIGGSQSK